jgi:alpha-1,4-digalacturonate transport system permease protein
MKNEIGAGFSKVVYDVCALGICIVFLVPVLWAILSAFQAPSNLFTFPPNLDPRKLSLVNFASVFATGDVPRYAMNSVIVATTSSLLTVIASSMAGFALAKYRFLGRNFLLLLIISVLLIPLQVLMVPVFLILKTLGWINSLIGIIIPPDRWSVPLENLSPHHSAIVCSCPGSRRDPKFYLALERLLMAVDRD